MFLFQRQKPYTLSEVYGFLFNIIQTKGMGDVFTIKQRGNMFVCD
ncbi:hypothetical protein J2S17_000592 [Cytobacillus purgationiresistens]|uniref:Uncharacterized protein n=1 Tax=Cytobacillus purgationiresistens TaxID=863449 RepID=A0ABU0ABU4_9BACI|nr:hypothetical protein [Cytobacillus purgationiresistens]